MTKFLYGISILALSAGLAVAQSNPTDQGQAGSQNSSTPNQTTTTPDNYATAPSSQSSGQTGVIGQSNPSAPRDRAQLPRQAPLKAQLPPPRRARQLRVRQLQ